MAASMEQIIAKIIQQMFPGMDAGGGGHATTSGAFGQSAVNSAIPYATGNPMLQIMMRGFLGPMGKNVGNAMFPGMSGGLNVNDSTMGQMQRRANKDLLALARTRVSGGYRDAQAGWKDGLVSPLQGVAAQFTGYSDISKTMTANNFGFLSMPGAMRADGGSFLSDAQNQRNRAIRSRLFGRKLGAHEKATPETQGLMRTLTKDYLSDTSAYGNMKGGEVGLIASSLASRDLLPSAAKDKDHSKTIQKIKETAQSLKSIRDIIKGPLKEVIAQMDQTFGGGYMNTFGSGGAANLVNKMRSAAKMGGFSTKQLMSLAPGAKNLTAQLGEMTQGSSAAISTVALLMGLTRSRDKSFTNDKDTTSYVTKKTVGAQQSDIARSIYGARSHVAEGSKEAYDKAIRAAQDKAQSEGRVLSAADVAEVATANGAKMTTAQVVASRHSSGAERELSNSHVGTDMALREQRAYELRRRRLSLARDKDISEAELQKIAKSKNMSVDDLLFTSVHTWGLKAKNGVDAATREMVIGNTVTRGDLKKSHEQNLLYGRLDEAEDRARISDRMAKMYSESAYGAGLGVNLYRAASGTDGETTLRGKIGTMLNTTKGGDAAFAKMLMGKTAKKKKGRNTTEEEQKQEVTDFLTKVTKKAKDLGLNEEESAAFIESANKDVLIRHDGFSGYFKSDDYTKRVQNIKDDMSGLLKGDAYEDRLAKQIKKRRKRGGDHVLLPSEKKEARRAADKETILTEVGSRIKKYEGMKELSSEDKEELSKLKKLKKAGSEASLDEFDDVVASSGVRGTKGKTTAALGKSETSVMTMISDAFQEYVPRLVTGIDKLATNANTLIERLNEPMPNLMWDYMKSKLTP